MSVQSSPRDEGSYKAHVEQGVPVVFAASVPFPLSSPAEPLEELPVALPLVPFGGMRVSLGVEMSEALPQPSPSPPPSGGAAPMALMDWPWQRRRAPHECREAHWERSGHLPLEAPRLPASGPRAWKGRRRGGRAVRQLAAALVAAAVAACLLQRTLSCLSGSLRVAGFASHAGEWGMSRQHRPAPRRVGRCAMPSDRISAARILELMPSEPGKSSDQEGFEKLCTRWNREEAEAVERSKRTLQSPNTTKQAKVRGIDELEYWAIRRGGYDAEIVLIGTLRSPDKDLAGKAHISLKKTWASHFNAWVNSAIGHAKAMQNRGRTDEALDVFNKVIFENPLWGEGYHLRAKVWNQLKDQNKTIQDLKSALEFCPNNYLVMVELAITLMDKCQEYDEADKLFRSALDLCPFLPVGAFTSVLYEKAPHLKVAAEKLKESTKFSAEAPPPRLMPDSWIDRPEATDRPNQLFLRVGAELEQWFSEMRYHDLTRGQQRKLWSILVIRWDPDKHPRSLRSFTTQVHEALKARRERELAKAEEEGGTLETQAKHQDDDDARNFLRRLRADRARKRQLEDAA